MPLTIRGTWGDFWCTSEFWRTLGSYWRIKKRIRATFRFSDGRTGKQTADHDGKLRSTVDKKVTKSTIKREGNFEDTGGVKILTVEPNCEP